MSFLRLSKFIGQRNLSYAITVQYLLLRARGDCLFRQLSVNVSCNRIPDQRWLPTTRTRSRSLFFEGEAASCPILAHGDLKVRNSVEKKRIRAKKPPASWNPPPLPQNSRSFSISSSHHAYLGYVCSFVRHGWCTIRVFFLLWVMFFEGFYALWAFSLGFWGCARDIDRTYLQCNVCGDTIWVE